MKEENEGYLHNSNADYTRMFDKRVERLAF